MASFKEIVEFQRKFDRTHGMSWDTARTEQERLQKLQYLAIALSGAVGKFSDILKRIMREWMVRGVLPEDQMTRTLRSELVDVFIYTIIASSALQMDLEKEYFEKMRMNEVRLKGFEQ